MNQLLTPVQLLHPVNHGVVVAVHNGAKARVIELRCHLRITRVECRHVGDVKQKTGTDSAAVVLVQHDCRPFRRILSLAVFDDPRRRHSFPLPFFLHQSANRKMRVVVDIGEVLEHTLLYARRDGVESQGEGNLTNLPVGQD